MHGTNHCPLHVWSDPCAPHEWSRPQISVPVEGTDWHSTQRINPAPLDHHCCANLRKQLPSTLTLASLTSSPFQAHSENPFWFHSSPAHFVHGQSTALTGGGASQSICAPENAAEADATGHWQLKSPTANLPVVFVWESTSHRIVPHPYIDHV